MSFIVVWVLILTVVCIYQAHRISVLTGIIREFDEKLRAVSKKTSPCAVHVTKEEAPVTPLPVKEAAEPSLIAANIAPVPAEKAEAPAVNIPKKIENREPRSEVLSAALNFVKGGNIWVAGGIIFVVLGVTFAYRYISQIYHIPGEVKVTAGVLLGFILFIIGWRKRDHKRSFALIIQGGGIGIIYLSFFAAAKVYEIIPYNAAFAFIIVLIAMCGVLSILQDSQPMAFFAAVIGFAAPVLLSEGSNNYIGLFSYYTALNLGILAAAFRRYWRYLNGAGFLFTYVVGLFWGMKYYADEYFVHILLFTIAFFLIYTAINVISSLKQESKKVENVFAVATPFVFMVILFYITGSYRYGQAIASFSLGIFYFVLCIFIIKKLQDKLKHLATLYLSMGIIFLNFSIPLALPGNWTAGIWAVEGAMLAVLGAYQRSRFFRWFGLILISGASFAAWEADRRYNAAALFNSVFICRFLAASAMLAAAGAFHKLKGIEGIVLSRIALAVGVLLWYTAFAVEIYHQEFFEFRYTCVFMLVTLSALVFAYVGRALKWKLPQIAALTPVLFLLFMITPLILSLPFSGVYSSFYSWSFYNVIYMTEYNWIAWAVFLPVQWFLLSIYRPDGSRLVSRSFIVPVHAATMFIIVLMIGGNIQYLWNYSVYKLFESSIYFHNILGVAAISAAVIFITRPVGQRIKCVGEYPEAYRIAGAGALCAYLLIWTLFLCRVSNQTVDMLCLPVLNTADITSALALITVTYWHVWLRQHHDLSKCLKITLTTVLGFTVFLWLHALTGRAIFFFTSDGVWDNFSMQWLFNSGAYQLAVAVLWGATGFFLMILGHKMQRRGYWVLGAVLLASDALKLFMIDLSRVGTLPRIGSFMAVGLIFIIIGYFIPLPPKGKDNDKDKNNDKNS